MCLKEPRQFVSSGSVFAACFKKKNVLVKRFLKVWSDFYFTSILEQGRQNQLLWGATLEPASVC